MSKAMMTNAGGHRFNPEVDIFGPLLMGRLPWASGSNAQQPAPTPTALPQLPTQPMEFNGIPAVAQSPTQQASGGGKRASGKLGQMPMPGADPRSGP